MTDRLRTRLLRLVALSGQTLVDVDRAVPQQPHHTAHQLHKRVGLLQNLVLRQIPRTYRETHTHAVGHTL